MDIKQGTIIAQYYENILFCFASVWPVLVQYLIVLSAESLSTHLLLVTSSLLSTPPITEASYAAEEVREIINQPNVTIDYCYIIIIYHLHKNSNHQKGT